jgi:hypothetical protein
MVPVYPAETLPVSMGVCRAICPRAVAVEPPKLLRMSLLTIPLEVRMLLVERLAEFEPSAGKGPLVSAGSSLHALAALEDEPRVPRP